MTIYVKAVFVNENNDEECPFDEAGMEHPDSLFIFQTLHKHLQNNEITIELENGIFTVFVENSQTNIDIIKNINENNLRFYVLSTQYHLQNDHYVCNCGCGLDFIDYETGLDVYVENKWIITENAMIEYVWSDYVPTNKHKTWQELKDHIIYNYRERFLKNTPNSAPYQHLYNKYVMVEQQIPIQPNGKLYYEHAF